MKNNTKTFLASALMLLAALFLVSCGSAEGGDDGTVEEENLVSTLLNVYYDPVEGDNQLVLHGESITLEELAVDGATPDEPIDFIIKNISSETINLTGDFTYSGDDSAYFRTSSPPEVTALEPDAEISATVAYEIVEYNEGLKSVDITIPNDTEYEVYTFTLQLPTTAEPEMSPSYDNGSTYNFETVYFSSPQSITLDIDNIGFGRLRIISAVIEEWEGYSGHTDFSIPDLPALPFDIEDTYSINIMLAPTVADGRYGVLRIETNETAETNNPFIINLCGQGYDC